MAPEDVRLSIIIPTRGRPTILEALASIEAAGATADDEVIVVVDGSDNVATVEAALARADITPIIVVASVPEARDWGNTPRNAGMALAGGTHLVYLDDDDLAEPGCYEHVRRAVCATPGPTMFQFEAKWGEVLPRGPFLAKGRCGGHGFVPPNNKAKLAPWGTRYEGDWDHISGTVNLWGGEDSVLFVEKVVARCREIA